MRGAVLTRLSIILFCNLELILLKEIVLKIISNNPIFITPKSLSVFPKNQ